MEWLINRRRMMCHQSVPPTYLAFEDAEFWRLTCINYGDYNEIVITDNGDNTVNITTTFKSVIVSPTDQREVNLKKVSIISEETNVDNSEGTYVAGTTKEAVGITQRQCDAIINLGYYYNAGITNVYKGNALITSANDLAKFRNMTEIYGNWNGGRYGGVRGCSNVESAEIPDTLESLGEGAFYNCSKLTYFNFKNVKTIGRAAFQGTKLTSVVLNEGFLAANRGGTNYGAFQSLNTLKYVDLPSTTEAIGASNFTSTNISVLVCRATTVPTLGAGNTGPRAIYVPEAAIEDYKAAPNWSDQASKIQAIEGTWYETHRELEPTT